MKKLIWFTHTNIDTRKVQSSLSNDDLPSISIDLSEFISVFNQNEIWKKRKYRTEYKCDYDRADLLKIKKIKMNFHSKGSPYSNGHDYENVLESYINLENFESTKIASSGISEASQIAVIVVEFESENKVIDCLSYEEEKDVEIVFNKKLTEENHKSWLELNRIKSIICEFIQFFNFNLHLNFLTRDYEFSINDKPNLIGFTAVIENENFSYETDKIDFFAHYVLYEKDQDKLLDLMRKTSGFWHKDIPSIHFFLDALKGNHITSTNFIKLVFTVESFFGKNSSNDFVTLVLPLILSKNIGEMKSIRETLRNSFQKRNDIVHGNKVSDLNMLVYNKPNTSKSSNLFFEVKNVIIQMFYFYINQNLYNKNVNEKINHELIFRLFPTGIKAGSTKKKK